MPGFTHPASQDSQQYQVLTVPPVPLTMVCAQNTMAICDPHSGCDLTSIATVGTDAYHPKQEQQLFC